jgi:hypothetical protein
MLTFLQASVSCDYTVEVDQVIYEAGVTNNAKLNGKYNKNSVPTDYEKDDNFTLAATPAPSIQITLSDCATVMSRKFSSSALRLSSRSYL